jgi:hypothetical protein
MAIDCREPVESFLTNSSAKKAGRSLEDYKDANIVKPHLSIRKLLLV